MGQMFEAMNQHNQAVLAQQEVQTQMMTEMVSLHRSLHKKLDSLVPGSSPPSRPTPVSSTPIPIPTNPFPSNIILFVVDPTTSTQFHVTLYEPSLPQPTSAPFISDPVSTGFPPHTDPILQPSSYHSLHSGNTK